MIGVKRVIVMGLPIACVLLLGSLPARSNTIINISAADSIPENMTKNDGFTLTNKRPTSYTFGNFTAPTLTPINNDPNDVVTAPVTITANMCSATIVFSGNSCTFAFHITTADPTATINDVGTFMITTSVDASWFDITIPPAGNFQTDTFNITEIVTVTDPVPLPTALPLFATGLGALGLLGWRRKWKRQQAYSKERARVPIRICEGTP